MSPKLRNIVFSSQTLFFRFKHCATAPDIVSRPGTLFGTLRQCLGTKKQCPTASNNEKTAMTPKKGRTVYSTESPVARRESPASQEPAVSLPPSSQSPRVRREKAGRGGKTVTVAGPLALARPEAEALLAAWKKMCGSGGGLKTV